MLSEREPPRRTETRTTASLGRRRVGGVARLLCLEVLRVERGLLVPLLLVFLELRLGERLARGVVRRQAVDVEARVRHGAVARREEVARVAAHRLQLGPRLGVGLVLFASFVGLVGEFPVALGPQGRGIVELPHRGSRLVFEPHAEVGERVVAELVAEREHGLGVARARGAAHVVAERRDHVEHGREDLLLRGGPRVGRRCILSGGGRAEAPAAQRDFEVGRREVGHAEDVVQDARDRVGGGGDDQRNDGVSSGRGFVEVRVRRVDEALQREDGAGRVEVVEQSHPHVARGELLGGGQRFFLRRPLLDRQRIPLDGTQRGVDVEEELAKLLLDGPRVREHVVRVVARRVVLDEGEHEPHRRRSYGRDVGVVGGHARDAVEGLADGDEVLEGLGHLEPPDVQVPGVREVVDRLAPAERVGLRELVVVVRELEVDAAAVDVDAAAPTDRRFDHRRALDVPPGPPRAPRRRPRRLARLGGFPDGEVFGVLLELLGRRRVGQRAFTLGEQRRRPDGLGHELAVLEPRRYKCGRVEVDAAQFVVVGVVAVGTVAVREAARDEALDEGHDLGDVLGHARQRRRPLDVERGHVAQEGRLPLARERFGRDAALATPLDDLVVDVRHVEDVGHVVARDRPQDAAHHVELHVGARVAHVGRVVHGRPADVHRDVPPGLVDRHEGHLGPRQRVVDVEARTAAARGRRRHAPLGAKRARRLLHSSSSRRGMIRLCCCHRG
mmetsp:Transcript_10080/g.40882  ORF Transcript_10080/g.40882 Transcript_10080/m.40882 type:complete len:728 (-) Transcript_10080:26-2209(-)